LKAYRKKPIVILAEPWYKLGDVPEAGITQCHDKGKCSHCGMPITIHGCCLTLEGMHIVCPGDWIIKGIRGEYYPVKPEIFRETYERVGPA
jgi:hypothetical protein